MSSAGVDSRSNAYCAVRLLQHGQALVELRQRSSWPTEMMSMSRIDGFAIFIRSSIVGLACPYVLVAICETESPGFTCTR